MTENKKYSNCDEVYKKLTCYLSSVEFEAGDRVPSERVISDELEVNRTTLRVAIHRLVDDGALERHVGVGTFFKIDAKDICLKKKEKVEYNPIEVLEIRLMIEPQIAKIAAKDIQQEEIITLKEIFKLAENKINIRKIEESDINFNEYLANLSKNSIIKKMYQDIASMRRSRFDDICEDNINESKNTVLFIDSDSWLEHQDKLIFALERNRADIAESVVISKLQTIADMSQ